MKQKLFIILALLIISPVKGQSLGQLDYYVAVYNTYYQTSGLCPLLASSTPIFGLKSPGDSFSPLIVNNNQINYVAFEGGYYGGVNNTDSDVIISSSGQVAGKSSINVNFSDNYFPNVPINTNTGNWIQSEIDLGYGLLQRSVLEVTEQILRFTSSPGIDGTWISIHGKGIEHYRQFNEAISSFDLSSFDLISGEVYEFCIDYESRVSGKSVY